MVDYFHVEQIVFICFTIAEVFFPRGTSASMNCIFLTLQDLSVYMGKLSWLIIPILFVPRGINIAINRVRIISWYRKLAAFHVEQWFSDSVQNNLFVLFTLFKPIVLNFLNILCCFTWNKLQYELLDFLMTHVSSADGIVDDFIIGCSMWNRYLMLWRRSVMFHVEFFCWVYSLKCDGCSTWNRLVIDCLYYGYD